jgi:hypothetical protein
MSDLTVSLDQEINFEILNLPIPSVVKTYSKEKHTNQCEYIKFLMTLEWPNNEKEPSKENDCQCYGCLKYCILVLYDRVTKSMGETN